MNAHLHPDGSIGYGDPCAFYCAKRRSTKTGYKGKFGGGVRPAIGR